MTEIRYSYHQPGYNRRHFVSEDDVRVVLDRLPIRLWRRLRAVQFNDRARGNRCLGYVRRGHDEIALCALPPRVSLDVFLRRSQSPSRFGAIRGCQRPTLAVRRFMLYDVFLHELGHLQIVDDKAKTPRRRFAGETLAQDFAESWCRELWSHPFDHADPVHNAPPPEELAAVRDHWAAANGDYKMGLLCKQAHQYEEAIRLLTRAVERFPSHSMALELLGVLTKESLWLNPAHAKAGALLTELDGDDYSGAGTARTSGGSA